MIGNHRLGLIASLVCLSPTAVLAQGTLSIVVADERGTGVESELFFVASSGERRTLASVGPDGATSVTIVCQQGDKIRAEPVSNRYRTSTRLCPLPRPGSLRIEVTSRETELNLFENAMYLDSEKDFAKSALVWSEYAARVQDSSEVARRYALRSFALHANVKTAFVFDSSTKRYVATYEFEQAIKGLQRRNGIDTTGQLDGLTLRLIAGVNINEYMYSRIRPPER